MLDISVGAIACYKQTLIIQCISARRSAPPMLGHHRSPTRREDRVDTCRGDLATES